MTLASWPERNLNGPNCCACARRQIDLGGIALPTVAGDAPLLDIIDLKQHEMNEEDTVSPRALEMQRVIFLFVIPGRATWRGAGIHNA